MLLLRLLFLFLAFCFMSVTWGKIRVPSEKHNEEGDLVNADSIMKSVFTYVKRNELEHVQYNSSVYIRHHATTIRKGPIVRYIPNMFRLERGLNEYFSECHLLFQFRDPGETDCKIQAYYTTQRYMEAKRMSTLSCFNFSVYEPNLFTDRILNPLHSRNRKFYRYNYEYTSKSDTMIIHRIRIRPKFNNDRLVNGCVDVNIVTGAVHNFVFSLRSKMTRLTLVGEMGDEGYASLLPIRTRIVSDFSLWGNRVKEVYETYATHAFSCALPNDSLQKSRKRHDLTEQCLLRVDTGQVITTRDYFRNIRPIPLRIHERKILHKFDSVQLRKSIAKVFPEPIQDTAAVIRRIISAKTEDMLLDSHTLKWGSHTATAKLKLPAVITPSMAQWSGSKGLSLQTRVSFSYLFKDENEFKLNPRVGYSFKQKQLYWRLPVCFTFLPRYEASINAEAGGGDLMYSSKQADEVKDKLEGVTEYDTLLSVLNKFGFNFYRDMYMRTDISFCPIPGLRLVFGGRYHNRVLTNWNKLAGGVGIANKLISLAPRAVVEWTPGQYYYQKGERRIPLYSRYPTFILDYEKGFAIGDGDTKYERYEFDVRYRLPLYALRSLYFRWGGGLYSRRGNDCFIDFEYFRFNNMPEGWEDDLMGEFQLLDRRWYNESRYYFRASTMYESPMLLFSRIKGLSRIVQQERVYCNFLSVRALKGYTEMGYAIGTHLFDLGAFMSIAPDHSFGIGVKCVLRFFEY